jgi:periplasmic protein CpxP/Spy
MKKMVIAAGLAMGMLLGVTDVYAGGWGLGPGSGRGNGAGGWGASNLTAEQQAKMQDLRQKHYNDVAPLREKMFSLRRELRTLWSDPKADSKTIEEKTKEMKALRDQMRDKGVQFRLEARSLLTPDQIKTFGSGCGQGSGQV